MTVGSLGSRRYLCSSLRAHPLQGRAEDDRVRERTLTGRSRPAHARGGQPSHASLHRHRERAADTSGRGRPLPRSAQRRPHAPAAASAAAVGLPYERHAAAVLAFLHRRTACAQTALDLTAETFAQAFASRRRYRDTGAPVLAWLLAIARHQLSRTLARGRVDDRARRRLGMERRELDDAELERVEELCASTELRERVEQAVGSLSPKLAEAVVLRVVFEPRSPRSLGDSNAPRSPRGCACHAASPNCTTAWRRHGHRSTRSAPQRSRERDRAAPAPGPAAATTHPRRERRGDPGDLRSGAAWTVRRHAGARDHSELNELGMDRAPHSGCDSQPREDERRATGRGTRRGGSSCRGAARSCRYMGGCPTHGPQCRCRR
jgi:DNA-directed RNA polymerase specialized sigma24 family protein